LVIFCDLLIVGGALLLSLVLIYWWFSRIRVWHYSDYLRRKRPASISIGGKGRTVVGEDGVENRDIRNVEKGDRDAKKA
jgi:5-keto 4-deoxyuronate isomerase